MSRLHIHPIRTFLTTALLLAGGWLLLPVVAAPSQAAPPQQDAEQPFCTDVQFMIDRGITPHDLGRGGAVVQPGEVISSEVGTDHYLDTWTFQVERPRNDVGTVFNAEVGITVQSISQGLDLELALYNRMNRLETTDGNTAFQPLSGGARFDYEITRDLIVTLVVRRSRLAGAVAGQYSLAFDFPGGGPVNLESLRDESADGDLPQPPVMQDGAEVLTVNQTRFTLPPRTAVAGATRGGESAQVFFQGGNGVLVNDWAERVSLLGSDLAVRGTAGEHLRTFYLEGYDHRINLVEGDLLQVTDASGTEWALDWTLLDGVWITEACAGFKLNDGRSFVGQLAADAPRQVRFQGDSEDFTLAIRSPGPDGSPTRHTMTFNWRGITDTTPLTLQDGVFSVPLAGERRIALQTTTLDLRRAAANAGVPPENAMLTAEMSDREATVRLDWQKLQALRLASGDLTLTFNDGRGTTVRPGANLLQLQGLERVIRIRYKDANGDDAGAERLLLPEEDGYVEIITPAGQPPFDGRALPGEPSYGPRALNNTGGNCYSAGTFQPAAECPPAGHLNPANGNLWHPVTDLIAYGGKIDLALTRSYNSALAGVDGAFGPGWTSAYRLDYDVPFDQEALTRPVTPETVARYPVGLDVTYAPRGIITFMTPSGSQHTFTTESQRDGYANVTLRAITMPGWELTRNGIRAGWTLSQHDGLTYQFDRAGRLQSYGYPESDRMIMIAYTGDSRTGMMDVDAPVVITDAAERRQLELHYDDDGHIVRSVLRAVDDSGTTGPCNEAESACRQTDYRYQEGRLIEVDYADGSRARYSYDANGQMVSRTDARAPIAETMRYAYDADGTIRSIIETPDGETRTWQVLDPPVEDDDTLTRTLTDVHGNTQTYTYALTDGNPRAPGESFTLLEVTSPLNGTTDFESRPIRYEWTNGLLTSRPRRTVADNVGRNTINYTFNGAGLLTGVSGGYPTFGATYITLDGAPPQRGAVLPESLTYPDGTSTNLTYNDAGLVATRQDRQGAVYRYTWDNRQQLARMTRENDGMVTAYTYNNLGLVAVVTRYRQEDGPGMAHTIRYTYDAFGQLTQARDSVTRDYTIRYKQDATGTTIRMTDAVNTTTLARYDQRGRLVQRTVQINGETHRHVEYSYDVLGRLTSERHLAAETGAKIASAPYQTTTYGYAPVDTLPALGEDETDTVINGWSVTIIDPYGRERRLTYDALGRLRQEIGKDGRTTRWKVGVTDEPGRYPNGLKITQRTEGANGDFTTTTYDFNLRWELRTVERGRFAWEIVPFFRTSRPEVMEAGRGSFNSIVWDAYAGGRPGGVTVNQEVPELASDTNAPDVSVDAGYDFLSRPQSLTTGDGTRYTLTYCPESAGATRVIYAEADTEAITCGEGLYAREVTYDAAGRLLRVESAATGTRDYTYTPEPEIGTWRAEMTFNGGRWTLRYNGLGELAAWTNSDGLTRTYTYDTLGRLLRVETPDQPADSVTYEYNAADLLISEMDDLERGTRYDYDAQGRLTVQQDIRNANAVIYGYNAAGQLATLISPSGNTTSFLYENPARPAQLTGIIEPTGAAAVFNWDGVNNALTYTDSLGRTTTYRFGTFGQPWRIDDALGRVHELLFDAQGRLTRWAQSQDGNSSASTFTLDYREPGQITASVPPAEGDDAPLWETTLDRSPGGLLTGITGDGALNFSYDALGRLAETEAGDRAWTLRYPDGEPVVRIEGGTNGTRVMSYDGLYRLLTDDPPGEAGDTQISYARDRGADVQITVQGLEETVITRSKGDATSRPPRVEVRRSGEITTYTYDAEGLLSDISTAHCADAAALRGVDPVRSDACFRESADQVWRVTERITYDSQGRPIRAIGPEQNIETMAYDDDGNLVVYQDVNGKTFDYTYDGLNRLTDITGPTGIRLLLRYNDQDNVTGICRARAEVADTYATCAEEQARVLATYTYDAAGRLIGRTAPGPGDSPAAALAFTYGDGTGDVTRWGVPGGPGVNVQHGELALGLPTRLDIDNQGAVLDYQVLPDNLRLTRAGPNHYRYNAAGRPNELLIPADDRSFTYDYAPNGGGHTVTDMTTGQALSFSVDARGALTQIGEALQLDYFLDPTGRVQVVDITRGDGQLVQVQRNRRENTANVSYFDSDLLADYTTDAAGEVQRQSLIGATDFFVAEAEDYIIVVGYDNDSRPLTMRISDRADGNLLYLLNFTYNTVGDRQTETRQYRDGTQVTVDYRYDSAERLTGRRVQINRPTPTSTPNAAPAALLFFGVALIGRSRRGPRALLTLTGGLALGVALTMVIAQPRPATTFNYAYDDAGNLTAVQTGDVTCARYDYDGAGRLIRVRDGTGDTLARYTYDARNRLSQVNDRRYVYQGDSDTLLATYIPEEAPRFDGHAGAPPAFFQQQGDSVTWLLNDGREQILAATRNGETTGPIWLFDPLGRYLSLQPPSPGSPCEFNTPPEALASLAPLQTLEPGMVWDATTGLHIKDGRAYSPEIGSYLQRDPMGPDAFGAVYAYPSRHVAPPIRDEPPAYTDGLRRLQSALNVIDEAAGITADDVQARHHPEPPVRSFSPLMEDLDALHDETRTMTRRLLDFPAWLMTNYNLPGPYRDADGVLRLQPDVMPGTGGLGQPITPTDLDYAFGDHWLPDMAPPAARLGDLNARRHPDTGTLRLDTPFSWRPSAPHTPDALLTEPARPTTSTPDEVFAWLPSPLRDVEDAVRALDAVAALRALPDQNGIDWLHDAFDAALPDHPEMPPADADAWLDHWFTNDLLGVSDVLRAWPDLPDLGVPTYAMGLDNR